MRSRKGEARIGAQQFMQKRRARPPMADDEDRIGQHRLLQPGPPGAALHGVEQRQPGAEHGHLAPGARRHGRAVTALQPADGAQPQAKPLARLAVGLLPDLSRHRDYPIATIVKFYHLALLIISAAQSNT